LAGGIAHDFNNILAIINGYARLARQEGSNSTRLGEWMDAIGKSVERGAGVVAQLMAFARKTKGEPAPFRVNAILQEILPLMAETFPKNIVFDAQLQPGLPLVEGDSSQLHQVFLNLFLNSRDAMPAGGTISIETSSMKAEKLRGMMYNPKDPDYVCILIRDNGIGMDEKTKSRIFEPFFTTKEIGKGSGLGLAVVYGVVTSHRGFIDVKSEPGKGTSFSIYLPSVPPTAKASTKSPAVPAVRSGNETILLVEDEEMLLDLLQIMIESNGYKVLTASNGEDAVKLYEQKKESIALVLSDMGLPKLGGWEAFQRMKQINPDVKAILASGYLDPHLKSEMLKGGARDFIQKPYVPEQILRRIREIIDGG
ncbi:MAG TPA: ATP-binding protein, partial [Bacteroidota bacterium]|nr:ATP-binding protein [Bacteroidota bacterium]